MNCDFENRPAAPPPDVRKVSDLPNSPKHLRGWAPIVGAAQKLRVQLPVGRSHHRTSDGGAEIDRSAL